MEIFNRIVKLLSERGISGAKMSKDLGFSNAVFSQWKSGLQKPSMTSLQKIATYFDVPIDYLLGNEQKKSSTETVKDEKIETIINLLSKKSPEQLEAFLIFLKGL